MKIPFFPPPLPMGAVNLCWEDLGFPGGLVVKSLPANAGDMGATPVQEDSTRHGATRLLSHNYWAHSLEPVPRSKRSHCNEKAACAHCN